MLPCTCALAEGHHCCKLTIPLQYTPMQAPCPLYRKSGCRVQNCWHDAGIGTSMAVQVTLF